jgi:hypothetical protein
MVLMKHDVQSVRPLNASMRPAVVGQAMNSRAHAFGTTCVLCMRPVSHPDKGGSTLLVRTWPNGHFSSDSELSDSWSSRAVV